MSSTQQEDSGELNDCQLKFLQSLSALLSEHQEVLPTLPKMCERFITAQANVPKEPNYNSNFDLSRYVGLSRSFIFKALAINLQIPRLSNNLNDK